MSSGYPHCPLCERVKISNGEYCLFHEAALSTVKQRYLEWKDAFGNISWERYLERIIGLKETGDSAREIAKLLLDTAIGSSHRE